MQISLTQTKSIGKIKSNILSEVKNLKKSLNIYLIFVLVAAFLWGTAGVYVHNLTLLSVLEMEVVFGRALFTSIIIGLIILFKDISLFRVKLSHLPIFLLGGMGSIVLFNYSYYNTMHLTNSYGIASVLLYTAPFFVVFIYRIFFGKKLTLKTILACVLAFIGCFLISGILSEGKSISFEALGFGLLTGLGYALYTVVSDLLIKRGYKTLTITFYVFLFAAVGAAFFVKPSHMAEVTCGESLIWILLMAVFNTVLPYILYTHGLLGVDSTSAPIIATLEPAVAAIIGMLFYGEKPGFTGTAGMILILISVVILNMKLQTELKLRANAKINLSLYIKGKRDDGYHLIDTVMQSVNLCDEITVKKSEEISVKCSEGEIAEKDNIAFKAAELFFEKTAIAGGAKIYIEKKIPTAAGLGGGSADAAAVLLSLDRIYKTRLSCEALCEMALSLGADVPFFIKGGTARAEGIGEILTPLKDFESGYFVLAKRDSKPSTKEMYRQLDSREYEEIDIERIVECCEKGDLEGLCNNMNNSFLSVWSENSLLEKLKSFEPLGVGISGSGPTFFAVFAEKTDAQNCADVLKKENIPAFVCQPVDNAIVFEN